MAPHARLGQPSRGQRCNRATDLSLSSTAVSAHCLAIKRPGLTPIRLSRAGNCLSA
jgi:hypothetical protein